MGLCVAMVYFRANSHVPFREATSAKLKSFSGAMSWPMPAFEGQYT